MLLGQRTRPSWQHPPGSGAWSPPPSGWRPGGPRRGARLRVGREVGEARSGRRRGHMAMRAGGRDKLPPEALPPARPPGVLLSSLGRPVPGRRREGEGSAARGLQGEREAAAKLERFRAAAAGAGGDAGRRARGEPAAFLPSQHISGSASAASTALALDARACSCEPHRTLWGCEADGSLLSLGAHRMETPWSGRVEAARAHETMKGDQNPSGVRQPCAALSPGLHVAVATDSGALISALSSDQCLNQKPCACRSAMHVPPTHPFSPQLR